MAEELSPESKLFVKEEIEKIRKEVKEEVEKVKSKAAKTFTTVVIIVGLLTGLGVYGLAVKYIDKEIEDRISAGARDEITSYKEEAKSLRDEAKSLRDEIVRIKTKAENSLPVLLKLNISNQDQAANNLSALLKLNSFEKLIDDIKNHTHTITYSGKESGTKYIKTINERGKNRVDIPDGHIIVAAYADGGGTIFYYKKLEIEAPK